MKRIRALAVALSSFAILGSAACSSDTPRWRLGALPYPGVLSLWATADPKNLGAHVSEGSNLLSWSETTRGIIYTCKAGFLDLAHTRDGADWTRFVHGRVLTALRSGPSVFRYTDFAHTEYTVTVAAPASWSALAPAERAEREERAARLAGQRLAYLLTTWHEVASWFGSTTVPFVSESRSAFTYDDMVAHVVGVRLGGEALDAVASGAARDFDSAMTSELSAELERLGAVSPSDTLAAAYAVEGTWWEGEGCLKRQIVSGFDETITPWIVPSFGPCAGECGEVQQLPWLRPAAELGIDDVIVSVCMCGAQCMDATSLVRRSANGTVEGMDPGQLLPLMIERMRREMIAEFGPDVGHP